MRSILKLICVLVILNCTAHGYVAPKKYNSSSQTSNSRIGEFFWKYLYYGSPKFYKYDGIFGYINPYYTDKLNKTENSTADSGPVVYHHNPNAGGYTIVTPSTSLGKTKFGFTW